MGLGVAMLVRVIYQKDDETQVNDHVVAYLLIHHMLLVRERIADELSGCRVSDSPTQSG